MTLRIVAGEPSGAIRGRILAGKPGAAIRRRLAAGKSGSAVRRWLISGNPRASRSWGLSARVLRERRRLRRAAGKGGSVKAGHAPGKRAVRRLPVAERAAVRTAVSVGIGTAVGTWTAIRPGRTVRTWAVVGTGRAARPAREGSAGKRVAARRDGRSREAWIPRETWLCHESRLPRVTRSGAPAGSGAPAPRSDLWSRIAAPAAMIPRMATAVSPAGVAAWPVPRLRRRSPAPPP